jgi:hypothetical protein
MAKKTESEKTFSALQNIILELDKLGYVYIDGFVSNKKDKVRATHKNCGKERLTKFCLYSVQECRYCKRQNLQGKYSKSIKENDAQTLKELHKKGLTNTELASHTGFSPAAIRSFLISNGLEGNKKLSKLQETKCTICSTKFTPKYHGRDKTCSIFCKNEAISRSKIKYSPIELKKVEQYKEQKLTNKEIEILTGVNVNTIKTVVKKKNLFLSQEEAQSNSYRKKLEKNPNAMRDMRESREFKYTIEDLQKYAETKNGKCLSKTYQGYNFDYEWECEKKHIFFNQWGEIFSSGYWCKTCSFSGTSKPELEILEWVQQYYPSAHSTRQIIPPKELDIFIPEINVAIEYCGLYWHSEAQKEKHYHYNKMMECKKKNIRLLTIFADEWENRCTQVKNFIKSTIKVYDKKIMARKTELVFLEKNVAKDFLEKNHIQGAGFINVAFGLIYENDLVAVVTGSRHHRQNDNSIFVLNRLAFRDGVQISGGASKLIKALKNYAKTNQYTKLISWSDSRWSYGNVYEKTGFYLSESLPTDYSYVVNITERESKQQNTKEKLLIKSAQGLTETEMANNIGYLRIWDCGKLRWEINL